MFLNLFGFVSKIYKICLIFVFFLLFFSWSLIFTFCFFLFIFWSFFLLESESSFFFSLRFRLFNLWWKRQYAIKLLSEKIVFSEMNVYARFTFWSLWTEIIFDICSEWSLMVNLSRKAKKWDESFDWVVIGFSECSTGALDGLGTKPFSTLFLINSKVWS